jgi:hypothetical protein
VRALLDVISPVELVEAVSDDKMKAVVDAYANATSTRVVRAAKGASVPDKYTPTGAAAAAAQLATSDSAAAYSWCRWYVEGTLGLGSMMTSATITPLSDGWPTLELAANRARSTPQSASGGGATGDGGGAVSADARAAPVRRGSFFQQQTLALQRQEMVTSASANETPGRAFVEENFGEGEAEGSASEAAEPDAPLMCVHDGPGGGKYGVCVVLATGGSVYTETRAASNEDLKGLLERIGPVELIECITNPQLKAAVKTWEAASGVAVVKAPPSVPEQYAAPSGLDASVTAAYVTCRWYVEGALGLTTLMGGASIATLKSRWAEKGGGKAPPPAAAKPGRRGSVFQQQHLETAAATSLGTLALPASLAPPEPADDEAPLMCVHHEMLEETLGVCVVLATSGTTYADTYAVSPEKLSALLEAIKPVELVECVTDTQLKAAVDAWGKKSGTAVVRAPPLGNVPDKYKATRPDELRAPAAAAYVTCRWYLEGALGLTSLMGSAPPKPPSKRWKGV